jgi:glucokinase
VVNGFQNDTNMSSLEKKILIGVDIGGTGIKAGAINSEGKIIGKPVTVDTGGNDQSGQIFKRITDSIDQVIQNSGVGHSDIKGIGLGVTGPLDNNTGTILECPQLPTMHFFPLRDKIIGKFKLPVFMDNDANALLLGESIWGAGKGFGISLGFTLGTGLGCAIVIDNKLFTGTNGLAGEIWPSPYDERTIEDIVSGRGVSSTYNVLSKQWKTAKEISELARIGDDNAIETWNIFGSALGKAIAWGVNMVDPGIVILGGSISNSMDLFYNSMDGVFRNNICPVPALKTKIVNASLGDNAGFIGSACLVMQGK